MAQPTPSYRYTKFLKFFTIFYFLLSEFARNNYVLFLFFQKYHSKYAQLNIFRKFVKIYDFFL